MLDMPPSAEGPEESQAESGGDPSQAHYRAPGSNCYACSFFSDPNVCSKGVNGGTVEPEGGCDLFEQAGDSGNGANGSGAPPAGAPPAGPPPTV